MKVLLIGELCRDETYYCNVSRISPEAPVPVADLIWKSSADGMAGNVNANLKAFGIEVDFVHQPLREHINKTRYVDQKSGQHLLRADSTNPNIKPCNVDDLPDLSQYDAVVVSDYNKGFVEYKTIKWLIDNYNVKGPVRGRIFIDSKKKDLGQFEGCIVKVNEQEYNDATSVPKATIVTLGGKGSMFNDKIYPAQQVDMFDVCGAGDTFLAGLVYKHLDKAFIHECIDYANKCAGIAVQHRGTYTLTKKDIESL